MSELDTGSGTREKNICTLDETMPCSDHRKLLSQDVYDLQSEYERIIFEEEFSFNKEDENVGQLSDDIKDEYTDRTRKGRLCSSDRKIEYTLSENTNKTITETKRSPITNRPLSGPENEFLVSAKENEQKVKPEARKRTHLLCKSLPLSVMKTEFTEDRKNHANEGERTRRTSDFIQEINKDKKEFTSTLTPGTRRRRTRNREKRDESKSHIIDISPIGEQTYNTVLKLNDVRTQSLKDTKKYYTIQRAKTLTKNKYTLSDGEILSNETNQQKILHTSKTFSSIMTLQNSPSGNKVSNLVSRNELIGSEAYVSECSRCLAKGQANTPAESYCLNCEHYLCQRCLKRHNGDRRKSLHRILYGKEIPGSFTIKQISEKCAEHPTENITFFCLQHTCLCCSECKRGDHTNCENQPIEDMLIHIPDILKLKQNISKASTQKLISLSRLRKELENDKETEAKEKDRLIEEIKKKSSEITRHIKKLEEDAIENVISYFDEKQCYKDQEINECEQKIKQMYENISYLNEPKGMKESAIKTVERMKQMEIQALQKKTSENKNIVRIEKHEFIVKEKLYKTVLEASVLGELSNTAPTELKEGNMSMDHSSFSDADKTMDKTYLNDTENSSDDVQLARPVSQVQSISIWTEGDLDSETCCTAIEVLLDGTVLVSDKCNTKLKWFSSNFTLIKTFKLSSEPWGITRINADKYIVTLPLKKSYQELNFLKGDIALGRKVALGIECLCAVQLNDKLMFAGIDWDKPSFLLTKLDGTEIEPILTEEKFDVFKRPNHLLRSLINPDLVFVSDADKGVFGINVMQRNVVFHYTSESLLCSMGMTITENGRLYICSQQTHNLHCISQEGQILYSVSLQNIMVLISPQSICYIPKLDEFLVAHDKSYSIFRFKLN